MFSNSTQRHARSNRTVSRAVFAAILAQLAGTAVALGQAESPTNVTFPAANTAPETRPLPATFDDGSFSGETTTKSEPREDTKVHIDENQIVDLHVSDEDLANVLEMLSIQSQRNIVASKAVNARVTANLYGVTFYEALDAILNVNGFGYIKQGNFIYVYTAQELKEIEKAQRQKMSKVINLNYLNAIDAAEFVKPLLSETGQIKTNGKTAAFPTPGSVPLGTDDYAGSATMVIIDFEDRISEIEALVRQLDTQPAQVLVEATILQTSLTEANAFGVDFSIIADMDFSDFVRLGGPINATNALIGGATDATRTTPLPTDGDGRSLTSSVGNTAGPGGLKLGIVKDDVAVFLRVLDEVTDTTILSNPKILALNRMPSRVLVGRKVGYLSSTSTDTATTQTVEFLDTGTQLNFRPFVTNEGKVRMELKPQVSEAVIRDTNDSAGNSVTIPDEITNELVTNVIVGDGQTVVLGGLFREQTSTARRQIPFLGDIPIIGQAFRGNDDNTSRNEIIFLITPTIITDSALGAAGQRGKSYIQNVRAGTREGLLFWSREKRTSRMNVEAERLAESGDTEKALWKIQCSLSMNHNQPEAIALRERLNGRTTLWPERSFLERVLHGDTERLLMNNRSSTPGTETTEFSSNTSFNNTFNTPAGFSTPMSTSATPTFNEGGDMTASTDPSNFSEFGSNFSVSPNPFETNTTEVSTAPNGVMGGAWSFFRFYTARQNAANFNTTNNSAMTQASEPFNADDNSK